MSVITDWLISFELIGFLSSSFALVRTTGNRGDDGEYTRPIVSHEYRLVKTFQISYIDLYSLPSFWSGSKVVPMNAIL